MQNYIKDPWKYIDKNETQTDKNEVQTMEVIIVIHCLCCQFKKNNKNWQVPWLNHLQEYAVWWWESLSHRGAESGDQ